MTVQDLLTWRGSCCAAQADGSAMYTLQALWSQARERAPVVTVVCANRSYAILRVRCVATLRIRSTKLNIRLNLECEV